MTPPPAVTPLASVVPPVNLNQPVENPALISALKHSSTDHSTKARGQLFQAVQGAIYLVAILTDEMKTTPNPDEPGRMTIGQGSTIKFITASKGGKHYLPLFTDWPAIRTYTQQQVSGLVMPAQDAWAFALQDATYQGVVINPGPQCLEMERPMLEQLAGLKAPPPPASP